MRSLFFLIVLFFFAGIVRAEDFVRIDYVNNPANRYGYGSVSYVYYIGKYEVTNREYCDFLNSVATEEDTYGLYSPLMRQHFMGGIVRTEDSLGFTYHCKENYENRPVVCTTWMNAIRYINWLHYNAYNKRKGIPVEQWIKATEGDTEHGAYDTRSVPEKRNAGARYWLPDRSEWEKAAYYDGTEWLYDFVSVSSNCYDSKSGWSVPYPHIAEIGRSEGPNGTYDQQGNAAEWVEDSRNGWKLALGGSLIRPKSFAYLGEVEGDIPDKAISTFGFRICQALTADISESLLSQTDHGFLHNLNNVKQPGGALNNLSEYVCITDAGNLGDIVNQYKGAVPYEYLIARTELSNTEYCRFLNAVAVQGDPFHLYHENMGKGVCGGILRVKTMNGFRYVCKEGWAHRPVVYISYYDLARYANWMHYGCPDTGSSTWGTTEGDSQNGAYDTSDFESVRSGKKEVYRSFGYRNRGARFWIPSEDEWYKAAYYDPTILGNRKYHDYPTRSSDEPSHDYANYMVNNTLCVGEPFFVAPVDSFSLSASYYGTLQQGGNVWEWIEDWQYGVVGCRGLRGGSWSYTAFGLNACNTDPGGIDDRSYVFGARLCKAIDESGWQPCGRSMSQSAYEWVMLLPKSRILLALSVLILISVFILVGIAYVVKCYFSANRKRLNK